MAQRRRYSEEFKLEEVGLTRLPGANLYQIAPAPRVLAPTRSIATQQSVGTGRARISPAKPALRPPP